MAPRIGPSSDDKNCGELKLTSGFKVYPPYRNDVIRSGDGWMEGKIKADGVWPYWRIHDKIYDLYNFLDLHPGGRFWLETTRGSDITESFESSHFNPKVYDILKKYYVKDATTPRNSPFTFEPDGFFMTLKRKVTPVLLRHGYGPTFKSKLLQDTLLLTFLVLLFLGGWNHSIILIIMSGAVLAWTTTVAHNFFHQKDNWRMYIFDCMLASSSEWRISHVLSHHNFPNTIYDYEVSMFEPLLHYLPRPDKPKILRFTALFSLSWFMLVGSFLDLRRRLLHGKKFDVAYVILGSQFLILSFASQSWIYGIFYWILLHVSTMVFFLTVGLTVSHHHPDIYHEGDKIPLEKDWGLFQVCATWDRDYAIENLFLSSISFGHHVLHHIFPTVDLSRLPLLMDALQETCKEFGLEYQVTTHWDLIKGTYHRLFSSEVNTKIPKPIKGFKTE